MPEGEQLIQSQNTEVEAALLGAILVDNRAYDAVADFLLPDHFYEAAHGRIFMAIASLIESAKPASPLTVSPKFENDPDLKEVGGSRYIYELAASVISITNAKHYGKIIYDLYLCRCLLLSCNQTIAEIGEQQQEATAIIERHEERLYSLTKTPVEQRLHHGFVAFNELIEHIDTSMKSESATPGVPTGMQALDNALGGLQAKKLIVIGARPSMGKTALACNIAWHAVLEGYSTVIFSLEMPASQIAGRFAACELQIPVQKIDRGDLTMDEFRQVDQIKQEIAANVPLHIDDSGRLQMSQLRSRVRRLARKGLDLIIVDYLQLIDPSGHTLREGRVAQISEITRGLKQIAKDFNVPVVALSQLSRQLEQRENKRPTLADLRESGSIEQDADTVLFLYRDEYYLAKSEPSQGNNEKEDDFYQRHANWQKACLEAAGICEAIIAKNRQGPTPTVKLYFEGRTNTMTDFAAQNRQEEMELEL